MEQTPSKDDILNIQKALNKVWTNVKIKEDGIMGDETIKYIKLYQKQNGLSETGQISSELKDKLLPLLKPEPQGEDSKAFLIRILRNHLNSMEKDGRFDAKAVAEVMINDSNNFLNKKDIFNK
jgi:peptidoglycan hydrolase-like protein with peptidoglycan-binding domain